MEFSETFECIWSSKESDAEKSLAFSSLGGTRATLPERRGEVARVFIARRHESNPERRLAATPPGRSRSLERPLAATTGGQEELCFINNNGSWYKKEPHFQYNNYQQKSNSNNQQSGYQPRNNQQGSYQPQQNPPPGFNNKGHHYSQQQANPSTSTPQVSSIDSLLKQILESQTRSEKHVGYELKNLHSKIDGSYNELNNKFRTLENQFAAMNTQQNRQQEYRDGYPKSGYPETTNPDPDIKSTDPTVPDPDTLNFSDIRIRPRANTKM
ncbi:hypothetical protein F2Q69_00005690 [Brassica cretica]|uniref:Uncharacterized protein n=1 Tax=Brassica cretica TaxID=69181 RepID=A0A8S9P4F4_BRACR|nr:hypothetical protein F2Q69_00005690 [Brassica cretica]